MKAILLHMQIPRAMRVVIYLLVLKNTCFLI